MSELTASELMLRREDLTTNPSARVPVCMCLDTSGSMEREPIEQLNAGVAAFYAAVRADKAARFSAEISVVTFGGQVQQITDFCSIDRQKIGVLTAAGGTPMGAAVGLGLDLLDRRKKEYKDAGVDYFQPWLVLMTDGLPDPNSGWEAVAGRAAALANDKKLSVFAIGVGDQADLAVLARFSPTRSPLRLQGLNFVAFFEWLGKSVAAQSNSTPGREVPLPEIKGWGSI